MPHTATTKVLVALDLSVMDEYLLSFMQQNVKALTTEKVHILHVDEALAADQAPDSPTDESGPVGKDHIEKVKSKIQQSLPEAITDYAIYVMAGDPEERIRQWCMEKDIDLMVVGQKATSDPEVEVKRLIKKPATSILRVPEQSAYSIRTIGVATDFSPLSQKAVRAAHNMAQQLNAKWVGVHTYQVPMGYHKSGKDHWAFAKVMEENARKEAVSYWEAVGAMPDEMQYVYDKDKEPAEAIARFAEEQKLDMLVIGSKGRTAAASLLMGSVAGRVAKLIGDIPLMIVKEKNTSMDLLDALKEV